PEIFFKDVGDGYFEVRMPAGLDVVKAKEDNRFDGKITVLSSAANSSGATILIALLQDRYGATVVGEPTGGSSEGPTAGIMLFMKLPASGITVRIPAIRSWVNVEHPTPGMGVMPDVVVRPDYESWLAGEDKVLEAAMR
ncbi:MAG: S41 family peptidase, partial [Planctomycetota bacterium]